MFNVKRNGVMQYKEIRTRNIEENPSLLQKYKGYFVSEKHDGWQGIWDGKGRILSKTGKLAFTPPDTWLRLLPKGVAIAGELVVEGKQAANVASLRKPGAPEWSQARFYVFDMPDVKQKQPFRVRTKKLKALLSFGSGGPIIKYVPQVLAKNAQHIYKMFTKVTGKRGGEGLVLTHPESLYDPMKRSNDRVKLKRRQDAEARVVKLLMAGPRLRSLLVKSLNNDGQQVFHLGIGLTEEMRAHPQRHFKVGQIVKYSFRNLSSSGKPKEARLVGKRHSANML